MDSISVSDPTSNHPMVAGACVPDDQTKSSASSSDREHRFRGQSMWQPEDSLSVDVPVRWFLCSSPAV
jgi:hypothetical protein